MTKTEEAPPLPATLADCHAYIEELRETESALSAEVLQEGKAHRHWKIVAEDTREALDQAEAHIRAMQADRESVRVEEYKRAREHLALGELPVKNTGLPQLSPLGPAKRTVWFRTRADALKYAENAGFQQEPLRRKVWIYPAWSEEWSLRVHCDA